MNTLLQEWQNRDHVEIEAVLGRYTNDKFVSGVSFSEFSTLFAVLNRTPCLTKVPKKNLVDYHFKDNVRGRYFGGVKPPKFVLKHTVASFVYPINTRGDLAIRFKISTEKPVKQVYQDPLSVRLMERWVFKYENDWSYELSKAVLGSNKEDACKKAPVFNIELEAPPKFNIDLFLRRSLDLVGRFDQTGNLLKIQPSLAQHPVHTYTQ